MSTKPPTVRFFKNEFFSWTISVFLKIHDERDSREFCFVLFTIAPFYMKKKKWPKRNSNDFLNACVYWTLNSQRRVEIASKVPIKWRNALEMFVGNLLTCEEANRKARQTKLDGQVECFPDDCRRENETGHCRRECHGSILALMEELGVAIDVRRVFLGGHYLLLDEISLATFSVDPGHRNRRRLNSMNTESKWIWGIDILSMIYSHKLLNKSRRDLSSIHLVADFVNNVTSPASGARDIGRSDYKLCGRNARANHGRQQGGRDSDGHQCRALEKVAQPVVGVAIQRV